MDVLHGVNLDTLGRRDPAIYGTETLPELEVKVARFARDLDLEVSFWQTNHEGEFCESLHRAGERADGLLLNCGAWTHYSYAIRDALEVAGAARRRGAHLEHRGARGVAARLGDPRPLPRPRARQGNRRLPGGARAAQGRARQVSRADRLAELMRERELDSLLVSDIVNVRWLCGFTGTNGACVLTAEERLFVTDFRYVEQAGEEVAGFETVKGERDLLADLAGRLRGRAGFDDAHVSVRAHGKLSEALGDGVELVPAGGLVERLREVKDDGELRAIGAAAELADDALRAVLERGLAGRTELEVARELEREIRERGAEDPSFPAIVAAGPHGALPARPAARRRDPARRARDRRLGGAGGRLLLRLHPNLRHGGALRAGRAGLRARPGRPAAGARGHAGGGRGERRGRRRPRADRGGRPRRALRPRARPRRRARGPRGPAGGEDRRGRARAPATS